jgi:capsular exopolysaccharide synthesis family protein
VRDNRGGWPVGGWLNADRKRRLTDYVKVLRRRWRFIVIVAAACMAAAGLVTYLMPATYAASAELFVSARDGDPGAQGVYQGGLYAQSRVKSYAQVLLSEDLAAEVIRKLKLQTGPTELASKVSATAPENTVLIDFSVRDASPVRARAIAQAYTAAFISTVGRLEARNAKGQSPVKVTVVRSPLLPVKPNSPRPKLNLALGLLVGLLIGGVGAILRDGSDTTLKSGDVGGGVGVPNLGSIPEDRSSRWKPILNEDDDSPRAEAFRTLRTNVRFLVDGSRPPRSAIITSAVPLEGKTSVACNLAFSLTAAGSSVALVDADLRSPRIHQYLDLGKDLIGLSDVLLGQQDLDRALLSINPLLHVLPAGRPPRDPSERLSRPELRELLLDLERSHDVVLIDTSPVLSAADAAIVAKWCEGAFMVVREGRTSRDEVQQSLDRLKLIDIPVLGLIFNQSERGVTDRSSYGNELDPLTGPAAR